MARAPGGPVHVLIADERAEHLPGCNMAFRREVLEQLGGFDPVYMAAGDDVDLCWRVLDRGWDIGFHPAALVWHLAGVSLTHIPYKGAQAAYQDLMHGRTPWANVQCRCVTQGGTAGSCVVVSGDSGKRPSAESSFRSAR